MGVIFQLELKLSGIFGVHVPQMVVQLAVCDASGSFSGSIDARTSAFAERDLSD